MFFKCTLSIQVEFTFYRLRVSPLKLCEQVVCSHALSALRYLHYSHFPVSSSTNTLNCKTP